MSGFVRQCTHISKIVGAKNDISLYSGAVRVKAVPQIVNTVFNSMFKATAP